MKIFFCDGIGKDKYGTPNTSDYSITFDKFVLAIEFPYRNENGLTRERVMPRSWMIDDESLVKAEGITLISGNKVPKRFKRIFIALALKTDLSMYENFKG